MKINITTSIIISILVLSFIPAYAAEIHDAVKSGDIKKVSQIIDSNPNVISEESPGDTPLHIAAQYGNIEMANLLLSKGSNINSSSGFASFEYNRHITFFVKNLTPLHTAVIHNQKEMVSFLVSKGADGNAGDLSGSTPIFFANNTDIAKTLVKNGADINLRNNLGETAIFHIDDKDTLKYLISLGCDINAKNDNGITPLHQRSWFGKPETVRTLISLGADINVLSNNGYTPLEGAMESFYGGECTTILLLHGADIKLSKITEMIKDEDWHTLSQCFLYSPKLWVKVLFPLLFLIALLLMVASRRFKKKESGTAESSAQGG